MAFVATKRRAENKSYKVNYKALKDLEKKTPHKDVASLCEVLNNTLSSWKKNKDKIFEKHNSGLISKRVKPEKYQELKKAVHKWFLILRSENVPISGPMLKEKALEFAGGLNIEVQWNLSKVDTYGTEVFVHFREESTLERFELKSFQI